MKDKIILYTVAVIVVFLSVWTIRSEFSNKGIAYIDIERLVNGYQFKKDLEKAAGSDLYSIKMTIDSLEMVRKAVASPVPTKVDSQLVHAKYVFEEYYAASNRDINKNIWERLNPIVEQYGKDRKLQLLIGANGAGTLLYAAKKRDMTDDLIRYVNQKYEKGN